MNDVMPGRDYLDGTWNINPNAVDLKLQYTRVSVSWPPEEPTHRGPDSSQRVRLYA